MKNAKLLIIFSFILFLALPLSVKAFAVKADDSVYVGEDETIEGNLYAAGSSITVDGVVTGDLICAGQAINVNGKVEGDVICAGQTINVAGQVNGSARVAGNTININGQVSRGIQAFGASIVLGKEASAGGDMLIAGASADIRGKVGGDLHGGAAKVIIGGEIGKNVRLKFDQKVKKERKGISFEKETSPLTITDGAIIGGEVVYTSCCEAEVASGASIAGKSTHNLPKEKKTNFWKVWAWGNLYSIFAYLVVGLVLISLWRKQIIELIDRMLKKIGASIGWGAVVLFLTPIIAILLLITIIGIPLSLMLIGVWAIALFISIILVGIMVGRAVLEKIWEKKKDSMIWAMIIGIVLVKIIVSIPFVGWLMCLMAMLWGMGGIWLYFRKV